VTTFQWKLQNKYEYNGKMIDQSKQRLSLCPIGLVKDHGGHLINQPRLLLFDKQLKTVVGN